MQITTKSGKKILLNTATEDAAIQAGIQADSDTFEVTPDMFKQMRRVGRPASKQPKQITTIRFDADVLDALKASGKGWQTRVNQMVRAQVLHSDAI